MNISSTLSILAAGTSEGATRAWDTRGRGRHTSTVSKKAARALKSYVPVTKEKRSLATVNEAIVAKLVGGLHTHDSEEFDVLLSGRKIGIEVKTVFDTAKNFKITQHPESMARKDMYMKAEGYKKAYTVIFDMRDKSVYVAKGLGSFRFDNKSLQSGRVEPVTLKTLASKIKK